jgi:phenylpropionate dioxygenase-like ring-hydroxylating dioxygenase large terminal subunit
MTSIADRVTPVLTPPELGRGPIPSEPYRSAAYFERERNHIFNQVWLCVGREDEIAAPGDFIVKEVEVCRASALIVRGNDRIVRAFHNVCAHRGNKVAWANRGTAQQFMCKYHRWTYQLDGRLRGVPDAGMFFDLDKAACGLSPIHLDIWEGFIFLNFAATPAQTLRDYLCGLGRKLAGYPFAKFSTNAAMTGVFHANWKVAIDAFQEGYHVGALHERTIGPQFTSQRNPFGRLISAELFGPHRSGSIWGNREFEPRPTELRAFSYNTPIGSDKAIEEVANEAFPSGINPEKDPNWAVEMNIIFPNLFTFLSKQGYITHSFWPLAHDRTRWEARMHFAPALSARQLFAQQFSVCQARDTFIEDGVNVDRSQEGISSGAKPYLHFQDNEVFLRHQYCVVEEYLRKGAVAAQPA